MYLKTQEKLKQELQSEKNASKFEKLAAALVSKLLDIPIPVAKSGFQYGGDAGPAGRHGRRFRLECKKYSDTTSLSDRELLGEIDQALSRDSALEAWFLIATRTVPEQTVQALTGKGEKEGVPVIIIDWSERKLAPLAALCAFDPDLVEKEYSKNAGDFARTLQPICNDAIDVLRRDMQSWSLGFESLRKRSHDILDEVWNSPIESNAKLGQNAAGGANKRKVKRKAVSNALNNWWLEYAQSDAPAVVIGRDGVGKTWATLEWLIDTKVEQPIVLIIPSSKVAPLSAVNETSMKRFLAERLGELTGVRGTEHWVRRLDYLLSRPPKEGPVVTVFFDGLNQEPSVKWLDILKIVQNKSFSGRLRIIVSTRNHHYENKLSKLKSLIISAKKVIVDDYDRAPGSELDQMLSFENLTQGDLHQDLIKMACRPRLFKLVVRFREKLVQAGQITIHRLLWEYGRDTLGERGQQSFSEDEWRDWLIEIAKKYLSGISDYSARELEETVGHPSLSHHEIYARLSEIVDGQFAIADGSGQWYLTPTLVAHALGVALLNHLEVEDADQKFEILETKLTTWLDPISGFDQRAEILRASVSILVEQNASTFYPVGGVLVTAWLQTQNVTDLHRQELACLAPILTDPLLDAIERSSSHTHASARLLAINAIRSIPRTDDSAFDKILDRSVQWLSSVSRDVNLYPGGHESIETQRSDRFKRRIGVDQSGPVTVVGVKLELVDRNSDSLNVIVPSILQGFPLVKAMPIFEIASVALAVRSHNEEWGGLKWLCLLNEKDPDTTSVALRKLSESIRDKKSEAGVHRNLPEKVAALLLWLSGEESDEDDAVSLDPDIDRFTNYDTDYLSQPGRSFFPLERHHAENVLKDSELPLHQRINRTEELWLDPNFIPPNSFILEIREAAAEIDVEKLNCNQCRSQEDHRFEKIEPVLARLAPDILSELMRRKMQYMANCPVESRYWKARDVTNYFLLSGKVEADAAKTLRQNGKEADEGSENYGANQLLMVEIRDNDAQTQFDELIRADLKHISIDFSEVLRRPTPQDTDALVNRYGSGTLKQQHDLALLLSFHPIEFSEITWSWLTNIARQSIDNIHRKFVFHSLTLSDALRFGQMLDSDSWHWRPEEDLWVNHFGTGALIEATRAIPFEQVVSRLAPWRLLEAARLRGSDPAEVRLAAEIFSQLLKVDNIDVPDPGSDLSVERINSKSVLFVASVSLRQTEEDIKDPWEAMEDDAYLDVYRRAIETASRRIQEARIGGANLYLINFDTKDFALVLQYAPDIIDQWLEGFEELTLDFKRYVGLAEAAFLALCEALLNFDPLRGVQLWRALRKTLITRYIGAADIDDLLHMVFRVSDSVEIAALREELIGLEYCHSDQALFDIAVAASYNGKSDWLSTVIEQDQASNLVWKRKRGKVLAGYTVNNVLPVPNAWPVGEQTTTYAHLDCKSERYKWIEACAHHWWKVFLNAENHDEAYAAWVLFLRSADMRGWVWMRNDIQTTNKTDEFFNLKLSHAELNLSELKRYMKKRSEKLDEIFLNRKIFSGIRPWNA
jgi:hypothetical protein